MKAILFVALLAASFITLSVLSSHRASARCAAHGGLYLTHQAVCDEPERVLH